MALHPGTILLQWFSRIPPTHAQYITHLYLMCTAKDMSPFFMNGNEAYMKFENLVTQDDIPVRLAARMIATISTISFLLTCIEQKTPLPMGDIETRYKNVIDITGALWEKTTSSWYAFVHQECSPAQIVVLCARRITT